MGPLKSLHGPQVQNRWLKETKKKKTENPAGYIGYPMKKFETPTGGGM
jgi:hypothetical protein